MPSVKRFQKPALIFCATQRTGSTMVADDFQNITGRERTESEAFWRFVLEPEDGEKNWAKALALVEDFRKDEAVFFDKVMINYLPRLSRMINAAKHTPACHPFYEFFAQATWVHVRRANIFDQAISKFIADRTNVWESWHVTDSDYNTRVPFDLQAARGHMLDLLRDDERWLRFFARHGIKPIEIFYEEAVDNFPHYLRPVADALALEIDWNQPARRARTLEKVGNAHNQRLSGILRDMASRDLVQNNAEVRAFFRERFL